MYLNRKFCLEVPFDLKIRNGWVSANGEMITKRIRVGRISKVLTGEKKKVGIQSIPKVGPTQFLIAAWKI